MTEQDLRDRLCFWGRSLFERGLSPGASGNISARLEDDAILVTPTNVSLGCLTPEALVRVHLNGGGTGQGQPTKELGLHLAVYRSRKATGAVVHLHSTYATALSCLQELRTEDAIAALTPYVAIRLGIVPLLPYAHPGGPELADHVAGVAQAHAGMLLQNHGLVVAGGSLDSAVYAAEELEEAAKLALLLRGLPIASLPDEAVAQLRAMYPAY